MADPSVERETAVYKAKLAEQAKRYDDMVIEMTKLAKMKVHLTSDERNLLSVAYKKAIELRIASWRLLTPKMIEEGFYTTNGSRVFEYSDKVAKEMIDICGEIVGIIDNHLIPNCCAGDPAARAYYFKMKGDFVKYVAKFRLGVEEGRVPCQESEKAYEKAMDIAMAELPPAHPVRLSVALNFSAFCYELLFDHDRAFKMAKEAFDEANLGLDSLNDEEAYKESTQLLQILKNKMVLWEHNEYFRA